MNKMTLNDIEVRVLGALIEKEATTPENYPLSLNALCSACNQKTARDPVMSLSEGEVFDAVESLIRHTLVARRGGAGSRVEKYAHRLDSRLTDEYLFDEPALAALCVLMLRGPQTVGEIRARSTRLYTFADAAELERTLDALAARDDGPFVRRLTRQSGHKEARYAHLFGGESGAGDAGAATPASVPASGASGGLAARLDALEAQVAALGERLAALERRGGQR